MTHRTLGLDDALRVPAVRWLAVLVALETVSLVGYFGLTSAAIIDVRYVLYPFVWINVGVLAVLVTEPRDASRRTQLLAAAGAVGYFLTLAYLSGLLGLELGHAHAHVDGFQFTMSAPGYGPRLAYAGSLLTVTFIPYRVIGYLALAYLVYAAALDLSGATLSGIVGLGSCIGCSLPLVTPVIAGIAGGTGLLSAATTFSIDLSTAVFVAAAVLLTLRPGGGG
ncbi:MAG: hypothetical protein ABEH78_10570 [Haloferacaceae archaeon]